MLTINEKELAARLYKAFGAEAFYGTREPLDLKELAIRAKIAVYAVAVYALGTPATNAEIPLDLVEEKLQDLLQAIKTIWNALPEPKFARCDDCGTISPIEGVIDLAGELLDERLDPGPTTFPVGLCPRAQAEDPEDPQPCGSLAYATFHEPKENQDA